MTQSDANSNVDGTMRPLTADEQRVPVAAYRAAEQAYYAVPTDIERATRPSPVLRVVLAALDAWGIEDELERVEGERDELEERYYDLLESIGGTSPG